MSSSIGGISNLGMVQYGNGAIGKLARPNPDTLADQIFSGIDTSSKGYIELGDLQTAIDKLSAANGGASADASELFTSLDTDSDGKVTKNELSESIRKLAEQLESQLGRPQMSGKPDPGRLPPAPADDAGFSKEELANQLQELADTDSKRSELISSIIDNFDTYDGNGDGKVNFDEVMTFRDSQRAESANQQSASQIDGESVNNKLMRTIMQLLQSYGNIASSDENQTHLSVTA